ncbi:DUF4365 domain-containing protein [Liberiplasma polymorphum]|uniref:DUF4365 domain-containing protein n=1 Tax=Liberiplasma polymorphum TaxID=3374570 RepID=UPI0037741143
MCKTTRSIAALGVNYVQKVVLENDDIMTEIHQENDRGLDMIIEFNDENDYYAFSAQVKTGKSYFNVSKDTVSFTSDFKHYNYWLNHNLYVILFVYDNNEEKCYWLDLTAYISNDLDTKNFRIKSNNLKLLTCATYGDLIDYVKKKIYEQKKNHILSNLIKSIISLDSSKNFKKLRFSFMNFRNEIFVWLTIFYKLKVSEDKETLRFLIELMSLMTHNPDIFWTENIILNLVDRDQIVKEFDDILTTNIAVKLIQSFDVDEYCRGMLGQTVYHIFEVCNSVSELLFEIFSSDTVDPESRLKAWYMYPISHDDYDNKFVIKKVWLKKLIAIGVIDANLESVLIEKLNNEGLFNYD